MPPKGWTKGFCVNGHIDPPRTSSQGCAICHAEQFGTLYRRQQGREYYILKVQEAKERLGGACLDCGYSKDTRALEFDHVPERGSKRGNITEMVGRRGFEEELAKCDLVCANCHRIRTDERGQKRTTRKVT